MFVEITKINDKNNYKSDVKLKCKGNNYTVNFSTVVSQGEILIQDNRHTEVGFISF